MLNLPDRLRPFVALEASLRYPPLQAVYRGPERRAPVPAGAAETPWLALMLDEIDYGMLLLGEAGKVLHANHAARAELDAEHPLLLRGNELLARRPADATLLLEAMQAAGRGLRRLLMLGAPQAVSIAVVPLAARLGALPQATLLLLGKKRVCERLSVQCFARSHGLTAAEARVLEALCQGLDPRAVAAQHGVGLATVRTQIGSIRAKTGAQSIRELVRLVAVLPPMVSSLRVAA
ncbi:MAG TPA: LuxR C-terminal-related transcriptional regulator [Rubrivivax sp.]|nr:LuxR C-terminal-related transcriptional regulator [Burkholderiales bacterium]HNT40216.1 LuxR C-terminal-related transcriptional regulator [Rubrivivax sp.]